MRTKLHYVLARTPSRLSVLDKSLSQGKVHLQQPVGPCSHDEIVFMKPTNEYETTIADTGSQESQKFGTSSISKFTSGRQSQNPLTFTCRLGITDRKGYGA